MINCPLKVNGWKYIQACLVVIQACLVVSGCVRGVAAVLTSLKCLQMMEKVWWW